MLPEIHICSFDQKEIEKIVVEKALEKNLPADKLYDIITNWCDEKIEIVFIERNWHG